jgi:hypothetical protein
MTKYALTVYSTLEALEAAVEAIDNDVAIRPFVSRENDRVRYALVTGGQLGLGFDGGTL